MAEHTHKTWRELCDDAIAVNDTDKLITLIHQLEAELDEEEKTRRQLANQEPPANCNPVSWFGRS